MIEVLYTCDACHSIDVKVEVRGRREGEDVAKWMDLVVHAIGFKHRMLSPQCHVETLTNAKIPLPNKDKGIGFE
jgi:hypothetical protein